MDQSRSQQPPVGVQADLCSKDQKETKRPLQPWNSGRKSKANLAVFPLADVRSESQQGNWLYQASRICWWGHVTRKVWPLNMGPQVINTEDCIKQTQSQVIVGRNTTEPQWGKIQPKNAWVEPSDAGRKKTILFPDPGGVLHLPPAVILFLEPNLWGGSRAPGGACLSWGLSTGGAVLVQRVFRFWTEGGCQAWDFGCRICGPAGRASFGACSGAGPEFILWNSAVTEQLFVEIATIGYVVLIVVTPERLSWSIKG